MNRFGHSVHWNVAGCFCTRFAPLSWLFWYSGSARRNAITLLGTAEVDCRRREGEAVACRSNGDKDLDASREDRSEPREGDRLLAPLPARGRFSTAPPGWKGSVTALGRDLGRPGVKVSPSSKIAPKLQTYLGLVGLTNLDPSVAWQHQKDRVSGYSYWGHSQY